MVRDRWSARSKLWRMAGEESDVLLLLIYEHTASRWRAEIGTLAYNSLCASAFNEIQLRFLRSSLSAQTPQLSRGQG